MPGSQVPVVKIQDVGHYYSIFYYFLMEFFVSNSSPFLDSEKNSSWKFLSICSLECIGADLNFTYLAHSNFCIPMHCPDLVFLFVWSKKWVIEKSPYSSHLTPVSFISFSKLKFVLNDGHFENVASI